jgi:molybdenum cofactor cytidylyltransferase
MTGKTGLILLAAGASRRMGKSKQLLPILGEPALVFCLKRILAGGITTVVVVVGHHRSALLPLLSDLPVSVAVNDQPDSQMAESVRAGLAALPGDITGILVALADHPLVLPSTYALLRRQHELQPKRIIIPTCRGRGGHPTLFPAPLLAGQEPPQPLNQIIHQHSGEVVRLPVSDPGVVMDMDCPEDYHRLLSLVAGQIPCPLPDKYNHDGMVKKS